MRMTPTILIRRYVLVPLAWLLAWVALDTAYKTAWGFFLLQWYPEWWDEGEMPFLRTYQGLQWIIAAGFVLSALLTRPLKSLTLWRLTAWCLYAGLIISLSWALLFPILATYTYAIAGFTPGFNIHLIVIVIPALVLGLLPLGPHYILFHHWKPLRNKLFNASA
jgi:hypothetical protein